MKLGIRAKLFLISLGVILVSVIVTYAYSSDRLERELTDRVRAELIVRAKLVALGAESSYALWEDRPRWHELARDLGKRANAEGDDRHLERDAPRVAPGRDGGPILAVGGHAPRRSGCPHRDERLDGVREEGDGDYRDEEGQVVRRAEHE